MVMSRRFSRPGFPGESIHQPVRTAAATIVRRIAARPTRDLDGSRGAVTDAGAAFLVLLDIYEKELYPEHSTAHHEGAMTPPYNAKAAKGAKKNCSSWRPLRPLRSIVTFALELELHAEARDPRRDDLVDRAERRRREDA